MQPLPLGTATCTGNSCALNATHDEAIHHAVDPSHSADSGRGPVTQLAGSRTVWIPAGYALAAIAIGFVLPRLEHGFDLTSGISSASAIAIYSTVASGTIALSAIVFSLTFVMVQFSATAYSPRLVLWLAEDPLISHALGIFTGAYLYSISAIAWIDR